MLLLQRSSPSDILRKLIDLIGYKAHLEKTEPDSATRWENVQELITFASDVDLEIRKADDPDKL